MDEKYTNNQDAEDQHQKKKQDDHAFETSIAQQTGSSVYSSQVKFGGAQGHGFIAERANTVNDILAGKDARIVGDDNALNGPDRVVDGISLQSKYCATAQASVGSAFESGEYRYIDKSTGKPIALEVPKGQGAEAVEIMREKIQDGKVPGVKDPNKAKDLVKEGSLTYDQVKNIARFNSIDGLVFDAKNACVQVIESANIIGIGAAVVFCKSIWDGKDFDEALTNAGVAALKAGGFIWLQTAIVSSISRTGVDQLIRDAGVTKEIAKRLVSNLGEGASSNLLGAGTVGGVDKVLRGNLVAMTVSVSILSAKDFLNFFEGDISFQQLTKNILQASSGVAGGAVGAAVGTAIAPGVGTVVGGIVGGTIASSKSKKILDEFLEDDAKRMMKVVQDKWAQLCSDYLLSPYEAKLAMGEFKKYTEKRPDFLKDIFRSGYPEFEASLVIEPVIEAVAATRPKITIPTKNEFDSKLLTIAKKSLAEKQGEKNLVKPKKVRQKKKMSVADLNVIEELLVNQGVSLLVMIAICLITWFFDWNSLLAMSKYLLFFVPIFAITTTGMLDSEKEDFNYSSMLIFLEGVLHVIGLIVVCWIPIGAILGFFGAINWSTFWDFGFTMLVLSLPFMLLGLLLCLKFKLFDCESAYEEGRRMAEISIMTERFRENYLSDHLKGEN